MINFLFYAALGFNLTVAVMLLLKHRELVREYQEASRELTRVKLLYDDALDSNQKAHETLGKAKTLADLSEMIAGTTKH
jgi:hypothetical protein